MNSRSAISFNKSTTKENKPRNFIIKSFTKKENNYNEMQRSNSVILNNKLTKSSFSIYDASLHTSTQTMKNAVKVMMSKNRNTSNGVNSKYLQRYHSEQCVDKSPSSYQNVT